MSLRRLFRPLASAALLGAAALAIAAAAAGLTLAPAALAANVGGGPAGDLLLLNGNSIAPLAPASVPVATAQSGAGNPQTLAARFSQTYNVKDFYASGSTETTTGTISSSSSTLTLAAAEDFANNEGILVNHAGAAWPAPPGTAPTMTAPSSPASSVTVSSCSGVPTGPSATITDAKGYIPAGDYVASCTGTTLTLAQPAVIKLSPSTTACASSCTSDTLYAGIYNPTSVTLQTKGSAGSTSYWYEIAPLDANGGVGAALSAVTITTGNAALSGTNFNNIYWTLPQSGLGAYYGVCVWRSTTSGSAGYALVNSTGQTTPSTTFGYYNDTGGTNAGEATGYCPSTPPASALADQLVTTISAGGGTTTLTLAASATNAATSQNIMHDDTAALTAAATAAMITNGGSLSGVTTGQANAGVYVPPGTYLECGAFPIVAPLGIIGDSIASSTFIIRPGCALPTVIAECSNAGTAYYTELPCHMQAQNIRITAFNVIDGPGEANAENGYTTARNIWTAYSGTAIAVLSNATSPQPGYFFLGQSAIDNVPGDCVYGTAGPTFFGDGSNVCAQPGANGIFANEAYNWTIGFGDVGGATLGYNYLFVGSILINYGGSMEQGALGNIYVYSSSDIVASSGQAFCIIDINPGNGVLVQGTGNGLTFNDCTFRWPGSGTTLTYSDINIASGATGYVALIAPHFFTAGSGCGNTFGSWCPLYNIDNGSTSGFTVQVTDPNCGAGGRSSCVVAGGGYIDWTNWIQQTISASTYTLTALDCNATDIFTASVTVTLPNSLPPPCATDMLETASGTALTLSAASGATKNGANGSTGNSAQYARISTTVYANSGGSSAVYNVAGSTR